MLKTPRQTPSRDSAKPPAPSAAAHTVSAPSVSLQTALVGGISGSLLLWAAFPPLNLPLLAWVAPIPWLWLCLPPQKLGWRSYTALWLAGTIHWLLMVEGIRLAHPALYAGWIALSAYLGVYLPAFVGLTRVAIHRWRLPLFLAAPMVWIGLELARGHLITGFSMGLLAHTQAEFPLLIQIADLAGGYTLSFVIMLVAACLTTTAHRLASGGREPPEGLAGESRSQTILNQTHRWRRSAFPLAIAGAAIAGTLAYGYWRLQQAPSPTNQPQLRAALIQGSLDTVFEVTPERVQQTFTHYRELTARAIQEHPNLDLVVWPESMFVATEAVIEEPLTAPPESRLPLDELRRRLTLAQQDFHSLVAGEAARANAHTAEPHPGTRLLVGATTYAYGQRGVKVYNSALLADREGQIAARYYKTHPVMFGEYIPFGEAIPFLYKITPMSGGLSIGDGPKVFEIAGLKLSPSICFESTVPHLIRGQLASLRRRGTPADVLVNVTNDGWFWGTSMLDLHFRCGVFRAVENRKPLIVAANTGIATHVAGSGVVVERGPKRQPTFLIATVHPDGRTSPYALVGDWPAGLAAFACLALAVTGLRKNPVA